MLYDAREYRARARAQLGGNVFSNGWLMVVLAVLIYAALSYVGSVVFIGAFFVEGFLFFGMAHMILSVARGRKDRFDIMDLTAGKHLIGDLFILSLLKNLFLLLWALIPIVGVFVSIVKSCSYAMVYYVKYDHPGYDWRACITESRRMMDGYKWRYFCLQLSFIGWLIVGALCFGVGTLWVTAYMEVAKANFYSDLARLTEDGSPTEIPKVSEEAPL